MKFQVPTKILFGSGIMARLKAIVEEDLKAQRIFMVTDQGIVKSGIAEKAVSHFRNVHVFDEVEPNPRHSTVNKAGESVRMIEPDLIIGLGGGSALDAAKAVALLATNPGNIEDYEGKEKYQFPPITFLAIPTTCGTGSEVTWVAVITHSERKFKMSIKGPHMFPEVALIDPDLLMTLPPALRASTGMDALTHAIEAYTVKGATRLTDIFAKEALSLIFKSLESAYKDIVKHRVARQGMMLGSTLAGMAFGNSDVGSVHCLAEAVGGLFDVSHGVANSIFLPFVMDYNLPVAMNRYGEISRISGIEEGDDQSAARKLIQNIRNLSRILNIPSFKDLGISENHFPEIAQKSFENNSNPSNPREMTVKDYLEILKRALAES